MDRFESLAKLTDRCSGKKIIYMHKIEIGRSAEVNKKFWSLKAINYFVSHIHY
jgi:hypothetical protein